MSAINQEVQELKSQFNNLKKELESIKENEVLTMKQLIKWLEVSRQTAHRWKNDGLITAYFLGGKLFFKRSEILASIEAGKISQ